jgi:FtsZ-interacting cell division protein YlmF
VGVSSLAAWGPTLVLAITLVSAAAISLRFSRGALNVTNGRAPSAVRGSTSLSAALREAEVVNAYRVDLPSDLGIHVGPVSRITPVGYQDGVKEIPRYFNKGYVVSVDLGRMSPGQAARLVDFCSGYLVGASGWLFQAADRVIVLTPTGRNAADAN